MRILTFLFFTFFLIAGCNKDNTSPLPPSDSDYEIINIYPHDASYFTQGFEFEGDTLVEGTGKEYHSILVKYNINSGTVYKQTDLSGEYFGEGITVMNGKIYQLTWKNGKCFVYNYSDLSLIHEFLFTGEGWGLANDSTNLIMSDGSDKIYFRSPSDFSIIRTLNVKDSNNVSVSELNELEYNSGLIYANIWGKNFIVSIDPQTGIVKHKYYMTDLLSAEEYYQADVLNGIAFKNGNFFITGKYWPKIFEIKLLDN